MEPSDIVNVQGALSSHGGTMFGMSMWGMLAALLFSMLGIVYFKRGKSEGDVPMMICGVALLAYTFFVSNTLYIVLTGAGLLAAPYFLNKM